MCFSISSRATRRLAGCCESGDRGAGTGDTCMANARVVAICELVLAVFAATATIRSCEV